MCEQKAREVLAGCGDPALGEWLEWTGMSLHLRRRLSAQEQTRVGDPVDVRGTVEARRRAEALGDLIKHAPAEVLANELGR